MSRSLSITLESRPYTPSAATPMPPTGVPLLYNGNPPGSAESPSGELCGPTPVPAEKCVARSEQGSCENCTPNSGPAGVPRMPGLKCSCTIWLAVRVENALPSLDRYAPVTALAMAASSLGTARPSSPPVTLRPDVIVIVSGAPFILYTASTLPTRSTTAITAGLLCACASAVACAIAVCTSDALRKVCALAHDPVQPESGVDCGGGGAVPSVLAELLPPPQPSSTAMASASH